MLCASTGDVGVDHAPQGHPADGLVQDLWRGCDSSGCSMKDGGFVNDSASTGPAGNFCKTKNKQHPMKFDHIIS
jgi:hypothetical protein